MVKGGGGAEEEKEGWFIYGFVARGTVVLAEYTEFTGNFPAIACPVPPPLAPFLQQQVPHTFNFLVHDGYAKESVPKHVAIAFLERLKGDFKGRYGGGKADTATAKSLNKEFGKRNPQCRFWLVSGIGQYQVGRCQTVSAVDRGEKLTDLQDKTMDLCSQAQDFRKQGTRVLKENVVSKHEN